MTLDIYSLLIRKASDTYDIGYLFIINTQG